MTIAGCGALYATTPTTADAASMSVSVLTDIDLLPESTTSGFSTSLAADLAATHLVASSESGFGSTTSGSTEAGAGVIRMFATSSVVDPLAHGETGTDSHVTAQASDLAVISETLQVTSTTLAAGSAVDLLFGLSFSQLLSSSEPLSIYLDGGFEAKFFAHDQSVNPTLILDSDGLTSAVMHTFVGQTIALTETMFGGAMATYIDQTGKSITDDATHSAHFYIDAQELGVTLIAESGHDYSSAVISPVPEPSEWAMLLTGFAFVGARKLRSSKRTGA